MNGGALSPELCSRIVQWTRRTDLPALCLTCKTFQREAEARLYESLILGDPHTGYCACQSLSSQERLGLHVRSFYIYQDPRRMPRGALPPQFWQAVQAALFKMQNLETLFVSDPTFSNTWILDPAHIKFQLREAKLPLQWDKYMVHFLESQSRLRSLQVADGVVDTDRLVMKPHALPSLQIFDGPLLVAINLLSCPLTHLQLNIDSSAAPQLLSVIPLLVKVNSSLCALSLLEIPEDLVTRALHIVSTACPKLKYVGVLPLPSTNVSPYSFQHRTSSRYLIFVATAPQIPSLAHAHVQPAVSRT